jgi:chaperonin GroES|tara:strand:+ start:1127 stop:1501 length:375 start_codon:yes stop_codon:yes gene_type:complete
MELEALFDAVIVKPQEEEESTYGSIVVPDLGKDRNEHGAVVAVGPGRHVAGVGFIETEIKVGDKVVLPTMGFTKLEHKGEEYYIGQENQILARIKKQVDVEGILAETEVSKEEVKEIQKTIENE